MNTIAIFTTTRADFGIYIPLINKIIKSSDFDYKLFVGGTHLSKNHGFTINEIKERGFKVDFEFNYLEYDDDNEGITKSVSKAIFLLSKAFKEQFFDFVCVLGDRYELLSIIQAAIIFRKPIIHIHGGEITEGAIDEQIRHMVTKASHLHFAACQEYAENIRKMGEEVWRVYNTGSLAVENIKHLPNIEKLEFFRDIGLDIEKKTALMTYHPTTLETDISSKEQINNLFEALNSYNGQVLITAPNVDEGNRVLTEAIHQKVDNRKYFFIKSLGANRYLSFLNFIDFVIGNSSSGLLEAPFFKIPTINIGTRQKGRIRHNSVIDKNYSKVSIIEGIRKAQDPTFLKSLKKMPYKFGDGYVSQKMLDAIRAVSGRKNLMIKKLDFPC